MAIQKYLNVNKIAWQLVDLKSNKFEDLRIVLDNVMKERTQLNVGTIKKQADIISYEYEETLWEKGILGEDMPSKLRERYCFYLVSILPCGGLMSIISCRERCYTRIPRFLSRETIVE